MVEICRKRTFLGRFDLFLVWYSSACPVFVLDVNRWGMGKGHFCHSNIIMMITQNVSKKCSKRKRSRSETQDKDIVIRIIQNSSIEQIFLFFLSKSLLIIYFLYCAIHNVCVLLGLCFSSFHVHALYYISSMSV